jgi:hypothetical protein
MRVFISYSHDSDEHSERVLALAERLRAKGVETWIDQYVPDPNEGWINWMRNQVELANRVLLVFTKVYQRRFEGKEEEGIGLGATFEGRIVTQSIYENGGRNAKFRAVIFHEDDRKFIPTDLRCFTHYRVDADDKFKALLAWIHGAPLIHPSEVVSVPDLLTKLSSNTSRDTGSSSPEQVISEEIRVSDQQSGKASPWEPIQEANIREAGVEPLEKWAAAKLFQYIRADNASCRPLFRSLTLHFQWHWDNHGPTCIAALDDYCAGHSSRGLKRLLGEQSHNPLAQEIYSALYAILPNESFWLMFLICHNRRETDWSRIRLDIAYQMKEQAELIRSVRKQWLRFRRSSDPKTLISAFKELLFGQSHNPDVMDNYRCAFDEHLARLFSVLG